MGRAVAAARRAFDDGRWSRAAPTERKRVLHRIADIIEERALELTVLGVRDNGTEFNMALKAEAGSAAGTFRYYAEAVDKIYGEVAPTAENVLGLVHREPVGVVGAIVPWNFPLMIGAWKLAPALATGNSVVLKTAETASLSLLKLAEYCMEAGLPDGVLNVVTGQGSVAGEALALSMDVDVLVFTGSGATGRRLLEYSARSNLKRVYLELGGKSPNVVFADAPDLEKAAAVSAMGIFRNSGQVCVAGSRLWWNARSMMTSSRRCRVMRRHSRWVIRSTLAARWGRSIRSVSWRGTSASWPMRRRRGPRSPLAVGAFLKARGAITWSRRF